MSLLSSKLIAINIVDVADGKYFAESGMQSFDADRETRLRELESQVKDLKQWKSMYSSRISTTALPEAPEPSSDEHSSIHSDDFSELSASLLSASPRIKPAALKDASKLAVKPSVATISSPRKQEAEPDVVSRIMSILESYGQNEENVSGDAWLGRFKFEPRVRKAVDSNVFVPLVIPAFPWKSVNKEEKVLGALPDLGEDLALGRLNELCCDIQQVYPPGAKVTITSDGLVYNDLLGISDEEVYEYGSALRRIPEEQGYQNIDFIRIMNLLGLTDKSHMTKEEYLESVGGVRDTLMERYLDPTFIAVDAIEQDRDTSLTYCGYLKFLAKDLRHSSITAGIVGKNEYRRVVKRVAQDMITRGKAFAAAIDEVLPDYVRLSIHRSTGLNKLSFPLVPQKNHFSMTPWHCCIAVTARGEFRTAHKTALIDSHDIIYHKGRPYFFRDRSPVWDLKGADFEFQYPNTIIVRAKVGEEGGSPKLGKEDMAKLKALGKGFSLVIASGFSA